MNAGPNVLGYVFNFGRAPDTSIHHDKKRTFVQYRNSSVTVMIYVITEDSEKLNYAVCTRKHLVDQLRGGPFIT